MSEEIKIKYIVYHPQEGHELIRINAKSLADARKKYPDHYVSAYDGSVERDYE